MHCCGLLKSWVRWENVCENLTMTFPNKKSIDTVARFRLMTNEDDQQVVTSWFEEWLYLVWKCYLDIECMGMKYQQVSTFLDMSLTGCVKNRTLAKKYCEKRNKENWFWYICHIHLKLTKCTSATCNFT